MSYKIIGDSCLDLTADLKKDPHFQIIPLTLQVEHTQVIDDETFDQKKFLELVRSSSECPQTACPSPEKFKEAFECDVDQIFVITLSEHLSGTYNSAVLAKKLYEEEHGQEGKNIAVFSSDSASSGELNIALYIQSLCQASLPFEEIVEKTRSFIKNMKTYFVIIKLDQARGINKALTRMADIAIREAGETKDKVLIIAHCNNPERAEVVKNEMCRQATFKDVIITETAGVATVYASDGGIIVAL